MSTNVVKINAIHVPEGAGPELERSVLVTSFGNGANWQFEFSSRSVMKSSFEMPISTL